MNMNEIARAVAPAARLQGVVKHHALGNTVVQALRGVDLELASGAFVVVRGPSGSGKSTLLSLLGCLDTPTQGQIEIAGHDVGRLNDHERTDFRARHIGFVFQDFKLVSVLNVLENVEVPLQLSEPDPVVRRARALKALADVGLADLSKRRPAELSGGQRQRVAVARALVKHPALVLADEPTANLDRQTGTELIALMRGMQRASGTTFVFSSHDPQLIDDADTQVLLEDGRVTQRLERSAGRALYTLETSTLASGACA